MSPNFEEPARPAPDAAPSRWPRRLALATLFAAVPLVFFGGTVTTLRAGLAIDGWLILEPGRGDHFLWFYPIEKWFRDTGTFVEHTHRQIGSLVGLLAIATVIVTFACDKRRVARALAATALLAIIAQGVLGGLRVLERSTDLAFLHGSFGQAVFALLGALAVVLSPAWQRAGRHLATRAGVLHARAMFTVAAVYVQIVIGAWLRHSASPVALALHLVAVLAVVATVWLLASELKLAADEIGSNDGLSRARLARYRKVLLAILGAQILLGVLAFLSVYVLYGRQPTVVEQSLFPTLHVMGGAALLLTTVCAALWSHRLCASRTTASVGGEYAQPSLGGTR
jgi:cytochrome c oxidase assembly protein subunit 15